MGKPAIIVDGLSKKYKIGLKAKANRNFGEALVDALKAPIRRLRNLGEAANGDDTFWALKDVSFEVQPGEVVGIIGRNGAGKSTLLKILSRITEPTAGRAVIHGRVGSLLEVGTGFHPELTGRENIYLNGAILGMKKAEITKKFDEIVAFSEIAEFLDTPVKRYSSGMYVRLAFAVAAHLEPEILIVDEVLAVGDAEFQTKCLGRMKDIASGGRTVLFVSHNMSAIRTMCSRCVLLNRGSVECRGTAEDVIAKYHGDDEMATRTFDSGAIRAASITQRDDSLEISVIYRTPRPIALPSLGFVIYDSSGSPIVGANPRMCAIEPLAVPVCDGAVRVRIVSPVLADGRYLVSLWFGDGFEDFINYRYCLHFHVVGRSHAHRPAPSVIGAVLPVCQWEFLPALTRQPDFMEHR